MNVAEYLRKFLNEQPQQEAAIPGLGVFYIGSQDGKKSILFKEVPPVDKAFLNFFAFEENLGEEEAKAEIEKWVRKILGDLKANGNVWIENIGAFDITSGKVVFTPVSEERVAQTENFGLETPAPAPVEVPTPEPEPLRPPVEEPKPQVPAVERPRSNPQRRPLNPPVKRPQPASQPTSSGKEIILGSRKGSAPKRPEHNRPQNPFYIQWWFILICILVILAAVVFAVKPVREKALALFKPKTVEMQKPEDNEEALMDLLDAFAEEGDESSAEAVQPEESKEEHDRQVAAENDEVARQIKAGQEQKKRQDEQVKKAQQPAPQAKPQQKPQPKAAEKKAVAPASATKAAKPVTPKAETKKTGAQKANVQKPVAGKCYIIVGSFSVEGNADRVCKEMGANGYSASKLYIEDKNVYYVSVKTCASRDEALKERAAFRDKGIDCWIFAN